MQMTIPLQELSTEEVWKRQVLVLVEKWQAVMGVKAKRIQFRKMKTRWGSCNPYTQNIRLNTELMKMPGHCLEYVVVHELVHLLEASHNRRFQTLMDKYLPGWRSHRSELNKLGLVMDKLPTPSGASY